MEEPSCAWTAVEEKKEDKRNRRRKKVRVGTKKKLERKTDEIFRTDKGGRVRES